MSDDDSRFADKRRKTRRAEARRPRQPRPLNRAKLEELALHYVSRFATTRGKLIDYLKRKLRERGWEGGDETDLTALAQRLADNGYIDDAAFGEMKARSLTQRGYGMRRLRGELHVAGVAEPDRAGGEALAHDGRISSAWRFAQRKRAGPFADELVVDRAQREKLIAAFLRAGHDMALARRILALPPGSDQLALDDDE